MDDKYKSSTKNHANLVGEDVQQHSSDNAARHGPNLTIDINSSQPHRQQPITQNAQSQLNSLQYLDPLGQNAPLIANVQYLNTQKNTINSKHLEQLPKDISSMVLQKEDKTLNLSKKFSLPQTNIGNSQQLQQPNRVSLLKPLVLESNIICQFSNQLNHKQVAEPVKNKQPIKQKQNVDIIKKMSQGNGLQLLDLLQVGDPKPKERVNTRSIGTADDIIIRQKLIQNLPAKQELQQIQNDDLQDEQFNIVKKSSKYAANDPQMSLNFKRASIKFNQYNVDRNCWNQNTHTYQNNDGDAGLEDSINIEVGRKQSLPATNLNSYRSINSFKSIKNDLTNSFGRNVLRRNFERDRTKSINFPAAEFVRKHGLQINRNIVSLRDINSKKKYPTKLQEQVKLYNSKFISDSLTGISQSKSARNQFNNGLPQNLFEETNLSHRDRFVSIKFNANHQKSEHPKETVQQNEALVSYQNDGDLLDSNDDSLDQGVQPLINMECSVDAVNMVQQPSSNIIQNELSTFCSVDKSTIDQISGTHQFSKSNKNYSSIKLNLALKQLDHEIDNQEMKMQRQNNQLMQLEWKQENSISASISKSVHAPITAQSVNLNQFSQKQTTQDQNDIVSDEHQEFSRDHSLKIFDTDGDQLRKKKAGQIFDFAKIYSQYLEKIITLLGKSKLAKCLDRVNNGLNEQFQICSKFVDQLQEMSKEEHLKQIDEYNKLAIEFNEYRQANNLDLYFSKYLNKETAKRTLHLVQELLSTEEEGWRDRLKNEQAECEKYQYSDTLQSLSKLDQEMRAYKHRLKVFDEENQQLIEDQKKFKEKAPLTSNQFRDDLNKLLQQNYQYGIYQSGKKVAGQLCAQFIKQTAEVEIQVDDDRDIKQKAYILKLEEEMQIMREEYQRQITENKEYEQKNADLIEQNKKLQSDLYLTRKELDQFLLNHKKDLADFSKLKGQIKMLQVENRELEIKLKEQEINTKMQTNINKAMKKDSKKKQQHQQEQSIITNNPSQDKKIADLKSLLSNMGSQVESMSQQIKLLNEDIQEKNELIDFMQKQIKNQKKTLKQQEMVAEIQNELNEVRETIDKAVQVGQFNQNSEEFQELNIENNQQIRKMDTRKQISSSFELLNRLENTDQQQIDDTQRESKEICDGQNSSGINDIVNIQVQYDQENTTKALDGLQIQEAASNINNQIIHFQKINDEVNFPLQKGQDQIEEVKIFQDMPERGRQIQQNFINSTQRDSKQSDGDYQSEYTQNISTKLDYKQTSNLDTKESNPHDNIMRSVIHTQIQKPTLANSHKQISSNRQSKSPKKYQVGRNIIPREQGITEKQIKMSYVPSKAIQVDNFSQTDQIQLINYACGLFMKEMKLIMQEEKQQEEEIKLQEIIKKAQHIIVRIKNQAAPSHGLSSNDFASQNPHSPVIRGKRTNPNKSWHFDVCSEPRSNNQQNNVNSKYIPQKNQVQNQFKQTFNSVNSKQHQNSHSKQPKDSQLYSFNSNSLSPSQDQDGIKTNDVHSNSHLATNMIDVSSKNKLEQIIRRSDQSQILNLKNKRQSFAINSQQINENEVQQTNDQKALQRARGQLLSQGALQTRTDNEMLLHTFGTQHDM